MTSSEFRTESDSASMSNSNYDNLVVVGRVRRPTGIRGAVLVEVYSGVADRFVVGDIVIANGKEHEIVEVGRSGTAAKLTLASVDSIAKADAIRDVELYVTSESLPPNPPGVYYHYEILGIDVVTTDGQELGTLNEILETGSNDVFVIRPKQADGCKKPAEILVPVLEGVIVEVNNATATMTIDLPEGIL